MAPNFLEIDESSSSSEHSSTSWIEPKSVGGKLKLLIVDNSKVDQEFTCTICKGILVDNRQCMEGHVFCQECVTEHLETNKNCPICYVSIEGKLSKSVFLDKEIKKLQVHCPNKFNLSRNIDESFGCHTKLTIGELDDHKSQCDFKINKCPHSEDCLHVRKNKLNEHEVICQYILIPCEYCQNSLARGMMDKHIKNDCLLYTIPCDLCSEEMLRKNVPTHKDSVCPEVILPCIFNSLPNGCYETHRRGDTQKHYDWYTHYQIIKNQIDNVENSSTIRINELFSMFIESSGLILSDNKKKEYRFEWTVENYEEKSRIEGSSFTIEPNEYFSVSLTPTIVNIGVKGKSLWKFKLTSKSLDTCEYSFFIGLNKISVKQKKVLTNGETFEIQIPFQSEFITNDKSIVQLEVKMINVISISSS